ncbi:MAG: LytR/AlgR family response regulator transcription factor [Bacteroidales bacterium]
MMPEPKKVLIIDDDADAINNLKKLLEGNLSITVVGTITNPALAVETVKLYKPDLIFLDIQMPEKDGFEVLRDLWGEKLQTEVIFVTAFDKFAIDAIRFSALDYLLKPISPFDLQNALIRFLGKANNHDFSSIQTLLEKSVLQANKLKFNTNSGFFMISPDEIVYIQADWNYSEIYLCNSKSELVAMNLGKLEEMLPKHLFCRINRSIIINVLYLIRVNRKKRLAILEKDGNEYSFKIPLLNIRRIERFVDNPNSA